MPPLHQSAPRRAAAFGAAAVLAAGMTPAAVPPPAPQALMIDWDKLLPPLERAHFSADAPAPIHDYLGEGGKPVSQKGSSKVNPQLAEKDVKIPGYVVPMVVDAKGVITAFFLVPYLGSCVHVPPPPPNQLVYVRLSGGGIRLETLEEPFWITGRLHAEKTGTRLATAAYTLDAVRMERYQY